MLRIRTSTLVCCLFFSCAVDNRPKVSTPPPRPSTPKARKAKPTPRPREPDTKKLMVVHAGGVGDVLLGKPLPKRLLDPVHRPEIRYVARMYADAQTFEGFELKKPPVTASFNKGPFHHWFEWWTRKGSAAPKARFTIPRARLAVKAVKLARSGRPVDVITITSPEPKTAKGIGVGSKLKEIQKAYGPVRTLANPPGFGNDRCVVRLTGLPVYVYFKTCSDAKMDGPATRILMWK